MNTKQPHLGGYMAQKPLRIDDDVYTQLQEFARIEHRSIANSADYLLRQALKDGRFHTVDTSLTTAEIFPHAEQLPIAGIFAEPTIEPIDE